MPALERLHIYSHTLIPTTQTRTCCQVVLYTSASFITHAYKHTRKFTLTT